MLAHSEWWQNSTPFLVWQLSAWQKFVILEDNLQKENGLQNDVKVKNEDESKKL